MIDELNGCIEDDDVLEKFNSITNLPSYQFFMIKKLLKWILIILI